MTVLVDTHAWLWWLTDVPELSPVARNELDQAGTVLVPAICLWEVAMLTQKGRFELYQPVQEFLTNALAWDNVELLPLGPAIAARAGALGRPMHGDPADRLIVASALELALPLVTRDARIRALPGVVTVW